MCMENITDISTGSICKTRTGLSYIVNTIAADLNVMQGAKASAAKIITYFSRNVLVLAPEWLNIKCFDFQFAEKCVYTYG